MTQEKENINTVHMKLLTKAMENLTNVLREKLSPLYVYDPKPVTVEQVEESIKEQEIYNLELELTAIEHEYKEKIEKLAKLKNIEVYKLVLSRTPFTYPEKSKEDGIRLCSFSKKDS